MPAKALTCHNLQAEKTNQKTGSTCLFCSSLMGRRRRRQRQRRSTLGSDPNGGGNFLSLSLAECRNCVRSLPWAIYQALTDTLSKSSRVANRLHWRPMETSLKMTLVEWNWLRFRILATCTIHNSNERTNVCGLILMRHATVAACGEILNRTNCKRSG